MAIHGITGNTGYPEPPTSSVLQKITQDLEALAQIDPSKSEERMEAQAQLTADLNKLIDDPTLKAYRDTLQELAKGLSEIGAGDTSEGWANITKALQNINAQFTFPIAPTKKD